MLVRLLYASHAANEFDADALNLILKQSKRNNQEHGVTRLLCYSGNLFMQVLEDRHDAVNRIYNRIASNTRHSDVELLCYEEIDERRFAGWSMGQVDMARLNPALLLKYSERATLDPYAVSGEVSMSLFEELVATASVVGQP